MQLPDGEPPFGPWRVRPIADVLDGLGRPALLAVDGRSGSGKTTVARRVARDGAEKEAFWHEWEAAERPFLAAEQPWEGADVVVAGAPELPHDPATELVVADRS